MYFYSSPFLVGLTILICVFSSTSTPNNLSGRHFRVIWPRWQGNPKGLSGPLKGGVVIEFLSTRLNFTYEMVRVTENWLEPQKSGRGLFSYLFDGQCDLIVHDVLPSVNRYKIVDLTNYWIYGDNAFLMPVSEETVWLGLCVSIVCVMLVFDLMQHITHFASKYRQNHSQLVKNTPANQTINDVNSMGTIAKEQAEKEYLYVFGNLLSQGIPLYSKRLSFRLVAGGWCLAAFFFVQTYTSLLFTYIVMPVNDPLMNSIYDITDSSNINVFIKMAGVTDTLLLSINDTNVYTKLRKRIDSSPNSRCNLASDCIRLITPGSRNVFTDGKNYLKDAIKEDFEMKKKCKLQIAKQVFMPLYVTFALRKNSPHTQIISQGLLELQQTGLVDFWDTWFRPMPPQCTGEVKTGYKTTQKKNSSLSIKNLTGPFIILLAGIGLSFLAFLLELIFAILNRHRRKRNEILKAKPALTAIVDITPATIIEDENQAFISLN